MLAEQEVELDAHTDDDSCITVTDLSETAFGTTSDVYAHARFDHGYQVAVTETIASLLPATEAFLRQNPSVSPDVRETLYRFERWLARRLDAASRPGHWVEHGAGI